jgi:hypothetical protein
VAVAGRRALVAIGRGRWLILASFLAWQVRSARLWTGSGDWSYFYAVGHQLLFGHLAVGTPGHPVPYGAGLASGPGGLHVYASHPSAQTGPPALVLGGLLSLLGWQGSLLTGKLLMLAAALALVRIVEVTARRLRPRRPVPHGHLAVLLGGLIILWTWPDVAMSFMHPDDVLVLVSAATACYETARGRPLRTALWAGLAAAAKPWGLVCLALALTAPAGRRLRALGLACAVPAACWLPFVLADPRTLQVARFHIAVSGFSALRVFGVVAMGPMPPWVRPAQFGGGLLLAVLAVRRGRWYGAPLAGIALRLAIEPGGVGYYITGLLTAAVLYDLLEGSDGWPVTGLAAGFLLVDPPEHLGDPLVVAGLKLVACLLCIVVVLRSGELPAEQAHGGSLPKAASLWGRYAQRHRPLGQAGEADVHAAGPK